MSAEAGFQAVRLLEKRLPPGAPEVEAAYARFVSHFPSDKRAGEIAMQLAERAFQEGAYAKSRFYAQQLLAGWSGSRPDYRPLDTAAYRLIAQGYLKEKAYSQAITFITRHLSKLSQPEAKREFESLLVLAHFQHGEALKAEGEKLAAADAFWAAYRLGEGSEMGPIALFEAAALWDTTATRHRLEEALRRFIERYPESSLFHTVLVRLALLYQETGRLLKAAETYEQAGRLPIKPELAGKSIEEAITLYAKTRYWEKVYQLAIERSKQFAGQREKRGEWVVKAAEAKLKMNDPEGAKTLLTRLVKGKKEKKVTPPSIAKAYLLLAELKQPAFEAIRLVAPIEQHLAQKKDLFDDLLHAYGHATDHPLPAIALHANYRIGEVFEEFSHALLNSERPEGLSEEEAHLYEELLIEQALPFMMKAEAAYEENVDLGAETGLESEWITRSEMRLERLEEEIERIAYDDVETVG